MTRHKMIFWDFDGTLGYRPNGIHLKEVIAIIESSIGPELDEES